MAQQTISGEGPIYPAWPLDMAISPAFASMVIDATGEMVAFIGTFWHPSRATKDVSRVGFRFGTVTKAGGSALTVSLQSVNLAAGPPGQPDEVQDQTVAIANANAAFVSNTWIRTGALSADRTLAFGELVAVVIEYDGGGRLAADTVAITGLQRGGSMANKHLASCSLKTASWAMSTMYPNVILECDDGTFGTLRGAFPISALSSTSYDSASAADELALRINNPWPCKTDGFDILAEVVDAGGDFDVVLYDGTSAMSGGTIAHDSSIQATAASAARLSRGWDGEISLVASHDYYLAVKPTTANNHRVYFFDVNDANHLTCHQGGTGYCMATRVDAGAWTPVTTRRPFMGLTLSAFGDDTGGGSSGGQRVIGG